jgi:predicted MPP superfamily phosphohydrolase
MSIQLLLFLRAYRWAERTFPERRGVRLLVAASFAVFAVAFFALAFLRSRVLLFPEWLRIITVYPASLWTSTTLFIGLILIALLLLALPWKAGLGLARLVPPWRAALKRLSTTPGMQRFDASRRTFLRRSMYGLTAVSFAGSSYGLVAAKTTHEITEEEFEVKNLAPEFDGFTITLLSDIHSSQYMSKPEMDGYVRLVNDLKSDMIVVPGDFVTGLTEEVYPFAESFSNLQAPHGVFGVTGNHEYYTQDPDRVIREVEACGVKLLHEEAIAIRRGDGELYLAGIDDAGNTHVAEARIREAVRSTREGVPRILLCHRPYYLAQAAEQNIDLVLSGHTHGGQIVFGRIGNTVITPASLASHYVWGRYRGGNTQMYVSRGIGTIGLPVRINCPSEITKITLRRRTNNLRSPVMSGGIS